MKNFHIHRFITLTVLIASLLFSCNQTKDADNSLGSTDSVTTIASTQENAIVDSKPILEYLRALNEDIYGSVSHIKDNEFQINDNQKRFVQYRKEDADGLTTIAFKQLASGNRCVFVKVDYSRYNMGNDNGYNAFASIDLIEFANGKWTNLNKQLPEKWTKNHFLCIIYPDNTEFDLVRIEYDKKTGKETATSQIESAIWKDNAFVVTETFKQEAKPYKIIVGYKNTDEFSEDWGFFMNDVSEELSDYQVTVVPNEGDKVIIDNPDLSLEIDLKPILAKSKIDGWCYIFIANDKQPQIVDYDTPDVTVSLAKQYFNLK